MKVKFIPILFCVILFVSACDRSPWQIPEDSKTIKQKWKRFDLSLIDYKQKQLTKSSFEQLQKEYPRFLPLYIQGIMRFGAFNQAQTRHTFEKFLQDQDVWQLLEKVKETFPDSEIKDLENELSDAFSTYHYYFPQNQIPEVFSFSSALTYNTIADDSLLGVGLDMYLGGDYEVYAQAGIPKYKFKHFEKKYIASDAMKAWLMTEFYANGGQNLLEQMIYHGKITYLLEAFFPKRAAHIFLNYNEQEYNWCVENEKEIWFHFVDMDLLHTMDVYQVRKYLGDAPFISGFPDGSPGRVGQWMGYQIVKAYMKQQKEPSLIELMKQQNADLILQESNYKPRR